MGMKGRVLAMFAGVAIVAAVAVSAASGAHAADPGITATSDHDRRHVPAHRAGVAVQDDPGSREGVLRLRQRPRRRQRPEDQLHDPRRRVRPVEDGAARAAARRAGQRLRGLRQPRHRAGPRDVGLPEQQQGAAGPPRDRRLVLGLLPRKCAQEVPVDDRLAAGLSGRGEGLRQVHRREHAEREDRRALPERRVRQELLRGPPRRPRREEEQHRRRRVVRRRPARTSRSRSWR